MANDPRLPNFFILGAAKCGTTSLYYYLKQHPEIYLPKDKEPHFFDNDTFWNEGLETYLRRHFKGAERYPARGEATPSYFHNPSKVIPRIREIYQDSVPRFIVIFRNPVDRAWSHYLHCVRYCIEVEPFEQALTLEKERLAQKNHRWVSYFSDGLYAQQLKKWLEIFPNDAFLFLLSEEFRIDPDGVLKQVCDFLNVDPGFRFSTQRQLNTASMPRSRLFMEFLVRPTWLKKPLRNFLGPYWTRRTKRILMRLNSKPLKRLPELDKNLRVHLLKKYQKDILELETLIGKDLSHWLKDLSI